MVKGYEQQKIFKGYTDDTDEPIGRYDKSVIHDRLNI